MKKFYYSASSCAAPHIGVVLDDVLLSLKNGDEVYWAYCHNALSSCWANRFGQKGQCYLCHYMYNVFHRNYAPQAKMIPVCKNNIAHKNLSININSPQDVRDFEYRGVKVGMSILSTYYGFTRDLDIIEFDKFKNYCIPLMKEICEMIDYSFNLIDEVKPDEVIVINGRHFSNRFFYDVSKQLDITYIALELITLLPPYKKTRWIGELPHNIDLRTRYVENLWEKSNDSYEEKKNVADSFYNRRRNGDLVADVKAYVADQQKGLLPDAYDASKRNIAIFNSSPDEFAAIGGEWDKDLLFDSQYEAIKYIVENSPKEFHYYLRIHPNLAGVNHRAHMELYQLEKYDNITVIGPYDKISTYTLMEKCEKTLTFGSTMGVEACYWGKPSIMIGHAFYEKLNVCYLPKSKEDLMSLLFDESLLSKPIEGSLKYAYYLMDKKYLVEPTKLDIDVYNKKWGINFQYTNYHKIWGKKWIYQFAYLIMVRIPARLTSM